MTKIVPVMKYVKYGPGGKVEHLEEGEILMYDVYVDGKWIGSRRLAKDAEMMLLHHNAHILDAARMVG